MQKTKIIPSLINGPHLVFILILTGVFACTSKRLVAQSVPFTEEEILDRHIYSLRSLPGADLTIFLDFNGHTTTNTEWNRRYGSITTPVFSLDGDRTTYSDLEKSQIKRIWASVAEDFAPFNINVTTDEPLVRQLRRRGSNDKTWGIRVCIGGLSHDWRQDPGDDPVLGVSLHDSFDADQDAPVYVFADEPRMLGAEHIANTISHEVGHALRLYHDGGPGNEFDHEYYSGHGGPPIEQHWTPIMGDPKWGVTQWSAGNYWGATNGENDLAIIAGNTGVEYRQDDYADSIFSAGATEDLGTIGFFVPKEIRGMIERPSDRDVFSFETSTVTTINIEAINQPLYPNLDIGLTLMTQSGIKLAIVKRRYDMDASVSMTLPEGKWFVLVEGIGAGNPWVPVPDQHGWTDYGSLGRYQLTIDAF